MPHLLVLFLLACGREPAGRGPGSGDSTSGTPSGTPTGGAASTTPPDGTPANDLAEDGLRVAIFGDYGSADENEQAVADLVSAFAPDLILTTGDNNYAGGSLETYDERVGQYYAAYIAPYDGAYGAGATRNAFWPSLGNHDWGFGDADGFTGYFTLPGNERYYEQDHGLLTTWAVDSDPHEEDGVVASSIQALWLRDAMTASTDPWKLVYFHHPPFSSGTHGSEPDLDWPFPAWGASMVWAGHEHDYERIHHHGVLYGITGLGGESWRSMTSVPVEGSSVAWTGDFGATFATFTEDQARVRSISVGGVVMDDVTVPRERWLVAGRPLIFEGANWRYLDTGVAPPPSWVTPAFDDSGWHEGWAPLGYGRPVATLVGYGGVPTDKHVTTWFRGSFTLGDPATWDALELSVTVEDGAVVYINGVEVQRTGLPPGPIDPETLALADPPTGVWTFAEIPSSMLVVGENVVAVEVHLSSPADAELTLDLWLDARQDDALVPFGAAWRYVDDGVTPPPDWAGVAFEDDGWPEGVAPFGFGGADALGTVIDADGDPSGRHPVTWYRHEFEVADPGAVDALLMELVRADAAVVFLNGAEVHRTNVVDGAWLAPDAFAASEVVAGWESRPLRTYLDPGLLVAGTNVVAAAVRVASPDREVHRFDLALVSFP